MLATGTSTIHIDNDTSTVLACDDVCRGGQSLLEAYHLAHTLERGSIQISCESLPRRHTQLARRHHAVHAEQRNASENERRHGGGEVHALGQSACSDRTAITRLCAGIRQRMTADRIDDAGPAFLLQRLAGL